MNGNYDPLSRVGWDTHEDDWPWPKDRDALPPIGEYFDPLAPATTKPVHTLPPSQYDVSGPAFFDEPVDFGDSPPDFGEEPFFEEPAAFGDAPGGRPAPGFPGGPPPIAQLFPQPQLGAAVMGSHGLLFFASPQLAPAGPPVPEPEPEPEEPWSPYRDVPVTSSYGIKED